MQRTIIFILFNLLLTVAGFSQNTLHMTSGQRLDKNQTIVKPGGTLIMQPNGNLVVAGVRSVTVNDETRTLKISGLVRALDVTPNNTVSSAQVADATSCAAAHGVMATPTPPSTSNTTTART